ncbi:hypothetical protein L0665_09165 [Methanogenium marinum]|uniref:Uncharacterized protein n=1 Tax=Methanogenium marinum TaxID=348610 RepID=A0A9Q4KVX9_9EURY|nr:hypothetical protein [Methanogenium marinum]MDE4908775.1 hypothetical protein [Methanogenium marinum]
MVKNLIPAMMWTYITDYSRSSGLSLPDIVNGVRPEGEVTMQRFSCNSADFRDINRRMVFFFQSCTKEDNNI